MVRHGPSKARRAAATAISTSSALPSAMVAMTCSVAGLSDLSLGVARREEGLGVHACCCGLASQASAADRRS